MLCFRPGVYNHVAGAVQLSADRTGISPTSGYELVTTISTDAGWLRGQARLTSLPPGATFPSIDDRFLYPITTSPNAINVNAVVGGRIWVNHSSDFSIGASTNTGKSAATAKSSASYEVTCVPVTSGVTLRSESGHHYAPATGQAALMRADSSPVSLILTAPAGAVFQKATVTPAGFDWLDLTPSRILVVPFEEPQGFFRVRQP